MILKDVLKYLVVTGMYVRLVRIKENLNVTNIVCSIAKSNVKALRFIKTMAVHAV